MVNVMRATDTPAQGASAPSPVLVSASTARDAKAVRRQLEELYPVTEAFTAADTLARAAQVRPSCIVVVDGLPDMSTPDLLTALGAQAGRHPYAIVVIGDGRDTEVAIRVLKGGAQDYLHKRKLRDKSLLHAVRNALHAAALHRELDSHRRELDRQREWLAVTLASVGDGVITTDTHGDVIYMNPVAERMSGGPLSEARGKPVSSVVKLVDALEHRPLADPVEQVLRGERPTPSAGDALLLQPDGSSTVVEHSASPIRDRDQRLTGAVLVLHDVTEARALALKMSRLAQYDYLTDLPNRMLLHDRLKQAIRLAQRNRQRLAVLFLDLDRFKEVNDTLGHEVGDQLLKLVARRLSDTVRRSDTVARIGGDEFVVVLSEIDDVQDVADVAQKLREAGARPFELNGHAVDISFSIGVSIYPDDGDNVEVLMRCADTAMYQAKEGGRNAFRFYDREHNGRAVQKISLETGLRRALRNDEFVLHYQPKLDIGSGRIIGAEALIRWRHPESGLTPPATFIPFAEESGLIVPIGLWVLREACLQAMRWKRKGLPQMPIAVNISAAQFHAKNFVADVAAILAETGISPRMLELELTETTIMQEVGATIEALRDLRAMGINVSIDDFGTGYSGLSYLKHFPVDTLKIDQSFVRDVATDAGDAAIVNAIIMLGRTLKQQVIAEGVETAEQFEFLKRQSCDAMQGHFFSRPLVADDFGHLIARHAAGVDDRHARRGGLS